MHALAATIPLFHSVRLARLDASHRWNHAVFVHWWLAYFTQHHVLEVNLCCHIPQGILTGHKQRRWFASGEDWGSTKRDTGGSVWTIWRLSPVMGLDEAEAGFSRTQKACILLSKWFRLLTKWLLDSERKCNKRECLETLQKKQEEASWFLETRLRSYITPFTPCSVGQSKHKTAQVQGERYRPHLSKGRISKNLKPCFKWLHSLSISHPPTDKLTTPLCSHRTL